MRPRKTFEGSCGPLPYQTREKPYTIVRNLTDTTLNSCLREKKSCRFKQRGAHSDKENSRAANLPWALTTINEVAAYHVS